MAGCRDDTWVKKPYASFATAHAFYFLYPYNSLQCIKIIKINDDQLTEKRDPFCLAVQCEDDPADQTHETKQQTKERKIASDLRDLRQPDNAQKFQDQQDQALIAMVAYCLKDRVRSLLIVILL